VHHHTASRLNKDCLVLGTVHQNHTRRCVTEDPAIITSEIWSEIGSFLKVLWLLLPAVLGFAGSMLIAHALIPSLAATRDLKDPRILKLRPVFYGTAGLSLVGVILVLSILVPWTGFLADIYERWWI